MHEILNKRKAALGQGVRYIGAAGLSACITFLLPILLHEGAGVSEKSAVAVALLTALVVNFLTTRIFVFQSRGSKRREAVLFAGVSLLFRGFEYVLFLVLFDVFGVQYIAALVVVLGISFCFKFAAYKFFVFRAPVPEQRAADSYDLDSKNRTYHIVQDHMRLLPNYYRWTYGRVRKYIGGVAVELGCGAGFGIGSYLRRVEKVYAVDHSPELIAGIEKNYPEKVQPVLGDLLGDWDDLNIAQADTAILMDVLEHFKDDRDFLQKTKSLLKPGGRIIVKVPAHKKLYSNIDAASGHYRRYDVEDLEKLGAELGFKTVDIGLMNMPGFLAYGMKKNSNSNFSQTFLPRQLQIINRAIPFIQFADNIMRGVLGERYRGLSVVAVFEV